MIGRALALGLATLLFASSAAFADETADSVISLEGVEPVNWARTGVYLELNAAVSVEVFRDRNNPLEGGPDPSATKPDESTTGNIGFRAGWRAARPLAFEIQYERIFNLLEKNDANLITLNARYLFLRDRRYQPFIRTGVGSIWGTLPSYWSRRSAGTQNAFVWRGGVGLDYGIDEHLTASAYVDYVIPTDEFHKLNFVSFGFGIRHKF